LCVYQSCYQKVLGSIEHWHMTRIACSEWEDGYELCINCRYCTVLNEAVRKWQTANNKGSGRTQQRSIFMCSAVTDMEKLRKIWRYELPPEKSKDGSCVILLTVSIQLPDYTVSQPRRPGSIISFGANLIRSSSYISAGIEDCTQDLHEWNCVSRVHWLALLLPIKEILGSNPSSAAGYPVSCFKFGHDFLPFPSQFIIH
jgi:hypothetical protein